MLDVGKSLKLDLEGDQAIKQYSLAIKMVRPEAASFDLFLLVFEQPGLQSGR